MANERPDVESTDAMPQGGETSQPPASADTPGDPPETAETQTPEPAFGWTPYAELINGRFAMIGFVALLIIELFTHKSFFQWLLG